MMIKKSDRIFLAGHKGLMGSAIYRRLIFHGYKNIITINRKNLDLRNQREVFTFFKKNYFKSVIIAAAKVGGIYANMTNRADFIYDNLSIQNNLIHGAFISNIKKADGSPAVKRLLIVDLSCSVFQGEKREYQRMLTKFTEPFGWGLKSKKTRKSRTKKNRKTKKNRQSKKTK